MKKDIDNIPENIHNKNTSPTDIKGKDINEANQTNSGAGGSRIKEGSNNPAKNKNKNNELDPMGTEVMQEDDYQKKKHGNLPPEKDKKANSGLNNK